MIAHPLYFHYFLSELSLLHCVNMYHRTTHQLSFGIPLWLSSTKRNHIFYSEAEEKVSYSVALVLNTCCPWHFLKGKSRTNQAWKPFVFLFFWAFFFCFSFAFPSFHFVFSVSEALSSSLLFLALMMCSGGMFCVKLWNIQEKKPELIQPTIFECCENFVNC